MELKAKVTSKGQLTIPKEVRRALGVREGDSLLFEVDEDDEQVRVRVERKPVSFADYEGAWREGKGMSLAEVDEYMRDLRGYDD
jgi:antitoxin PrlF